MENKETTNNEKQSFPLTFIHAERKSVDSAKCSYHGSEPDLMVLLAIIIKDFLTHGIKKDRIYTAVRTGVKFAKKEKRGKKK